MTFSPRRKPKARPGRFDLAWIPEAKRDHYLEQLRAQGVDVSRLTAKPKGRGRYQVSAPEERTVDGVLFDSKWEATVYVMLRDVLGKERIRLQVPYVLQDAFVFEGKKIRASKYVADYVIDGEHVCDAKGHTTSEAKMKHKQFIHRYRKSINLFFTKADVNSFLKTLEVKS